MGFDDVLDDSTFLQSMGIFRNMTPDFDKATTAQAEQHGNGDSKRKGTGGHCDQTFLDNKYWKHKRMIWARDWSWTDEPEFGCNSGQKIMEARLQVSPKQHLELQQLRQHIRSCFEKMFMRNVKVSDAPFMISGGNISECANYVYLGRETNMKNDLTSELGRRKRAAGGLFKSIEDVVKRTRNSVLTVLTVSVIQRLIERVMQEVFRFTQLRERFDVLTYVSNRGPETPPHLQIIAK
ncbi:hypothetical protein RB195_001722 [Necator americanus]|uniref:Guanylate-binding protein N-terminal domain-containing protein n=1 Tax=Necator americanus TaxID=51031 RepID=A0ABR1DFM7_NECAM